MNYINDVQPGQIDTEKTTANGEFAEILEKADGASPLRHYN